MSSPITMFIAFSIFVFCQYAIFIASNVAAHYFGLTGNTYWCVVVVVFLVLNEFCFGRFDFELDLDGGDDEDVYDWIGDDE